MKSDPDIQIRTLVAMEDMMMIEQLQLEIWPGSEVDVVPAHLLITVAKNGGAVFGAFEGQNLVGYAFGFLGTDESSPDRPALAKLKHTSHQLGVAPKYQSRGIGYRLKFAQREYVLDQGIRLITWTYDPLESRNAQLNIRRLGTICRTYVRNAYGKMRDGLNVGLSSDRFLVEWWVTSPRVVSRIENSRPPLDLASFLGAGAEKINPASLRDDHLPVPPDAVQYTDAMIYLVEFPSDIQALKKADPPLAAAWRQQTREIFETVFSKGYLITDFIYLRGEKFPRSYYILSYGEGTLG